MKQLDLASLLDTTVAGGNVVPLRRPGSLRMATLQLAFGLYQIVFGTQLLLGPEAADLRVVEATGIPAFLLGGATVLTGVGLVLAAAIPPRPLADCAIHGLAATVRLLLARGLLLSGVSPRGMVFLLGGLALLFVPWGRHRQFGWRERRDLYVLTVGPGVLLGGALLIALPPQLLATELNALPHFPLYAAALTTGGLLVLLAEIAGPSLGRLRSLLHLLAAAVFLAIVPIHVATGNISGMGWYVWHALVLSATPWIGSYLDGVPSRGARTRLPLIMAAVAAAPAIVCLALIIGSGNGSEETLRRSIWFLFLVVLPLTATAGALTARWLASPLRRLALALHDVGAGIAPVELPESGVDEVARLSQEFEAMRQRLAEREAELRRNQRQFEAVLEHVPAAVYLKDLDGRYLLASRRTRALVERSGTSIVGRTTTEVFPSPWGELLVAHDRLVLAACKPMTFDEVIPAGEGAVLTQLSVKFPLLDDHGRPYALGGISTDITERKWLEQLGAVERRALEMTARDSPFEEVLRVLVEGIQSLGDGMLASIQRLDEDGVHLRNGASPGLPPGFVRAIDGAAIGPAVGSCGTAAFRREPVIVTDIATDPLWEGFREAALRHGLRACWSTPILDARGEVLGTFAVYYKEPRSPRPAHLRIIELVRRTAGVILERRRVDEERRRLLADLAAANARFQSVFDGTSEPILILAPDGTCLDANTAAARLTGYTRHELRRLKAPELSADEGGAEQWQKIAGTAHWAGEAAVRRRDGTAVPVDALVSAVPLASGVVHVATLRDISDRQALERMRRDFLSLVGHELRNPLNSILTSAEVMRKNEAYNERTVDRILRQTRQLERIIADLQEAQQVESGQLRLRCAETDLVPLLSTCVEEAAAVAARHTVRLDLRDGQITGVWDGDRVCQIVRNLLSNAIKYSREGGEIVVRATAKEEVVRISVIDQGDGIPSDQLPHLFERFYRAPQSAGRAPGLGVGLYVCRQLVESHGGKLSVISRDGQGSTFEFTLPRTPAPAA